jgi:hypothetical protein
LTICCFVPLDVKYDCANPQITTTKEIGLHPRLGFSYFSGDGSEFGIFCLILAASWTFACERFSKRRLSTILTGGISIDGDCNASLVFAGELCFYGNH